MSHPDRTRGAALAALVASVGACALPGYEVTGGAAGTTASGGGQGGGVTTTTPGGAGGTSTGGTGGATSTGGTGGSTSTGGTGGETSTGGTGGSTAIQCLVSGCTDWVDIYGGTDLNKGHALSVGADNHVSVGGAFRATFSFAPGNMAMSSGLGDGFVVQENPQGTFEMVYVVGNPPGQMSEQRVKAIVRAADGSTLIAGEFTGNVSFGGGAQSSSNGGVDGFVVKLNPAGAVVWHASYGSANDDTVDGLAVDSMGNVVVGGGYQGTLNLPFMGTRGGHAGGSNPDVYVMKLAAADGMPISAETCGSSGPDQMGGVAVDDQDATWAVGSLQNSMDCDNTDGLIPANIDEVFVLRLKSDGTHWAKSFGGAGGQFGRAVAASPNGTAYVAGDFGGTLVVNANGGETYTTAGHDTFWMRLDGAGSSLGSKSIAGTTIPTKVALAVLPAGGFVLGGTFSGSVDFGGGTPVISDAGDAYVARYDAAGKWLWQRTFTGPDAQAVTAVGFDSAGAVLAAGHFKATTDFGLGVVPAAVQDVFLVKLRP